MNKEQQTKAYHNVCVYRSHLGVFNTSAITDVPQAHLSETANLVIEVKSQAQWLLNSLFHYGVMHLCNRQLLNTSVH